jgi:hypothetical protein
MAVVNILAATSIILKNKKQMVEDDSSITSTQGNVEIINLGSGQAAKVISLVFRNSSSSTAHTISVAVSENQGGNASHIYGDYSLAADTTWWAITPYTTGPIFLEEYELRAHGSTGANTDVYTNCNYELLYEI